MNYDVETEMDGDYWNVTIVPQGNTEVNDLVGRFEQQYVPGQPINGYDADILAGDDALHIQLDTTSVEDGGPGELAAAQAEITEYLQADTDLPDEFIDEFSGGGADTNHMSYRPK